MGDVHLGGALEPFARQVIHGAAARGREGQLAGLLARAGDQFLHRLEGRICGHYQQVRVAGDQGDGLEVLQHLVVNLLFVDGLDGQGAAAAEHQRVAIGGGALDRLQRHDAVGARAIFHHDGLTELGLQTAGQIASDGVRWAAGGKSNHQRDRLKGVLRGCGIEAERGGEQGQRPSAKHGCHDCLE
ncbi:hypothetical protein D3C87_1390570 [compost metagenome]